MKAIIFGGSGQDGFFTRKLLQDKGAEVQSVSRSKGDVTGDVKDRVLVENLIRSAKPGYIFHYAANSTTRHDVLFENHDSIVTGTLNILEAARQYAPDARIFLSGSALQFVNKGQAISETDPFDPNSAYAVARIQSVYAGRYYREKFGMKVYAGYFFNHDSELRSARHVNKLIIETVKQIARKEKTHLEIGNPDVVKEFNYAGDLVNAVWTLVNQDKIFEAVLGNGQGYKIGDWIAYCFSKIGLDWKAYTTINPNFTTEYERLVSNPALIKSLGWDSRVGFTELADLMWGSE